MSEGPAKRRRLDSDDDDDEYAQPRRGSPLMQYAVTAALPTDEIPLMGYPALEAAEEAHAASSPAETADRQVEPVKAGENGVAAREHNEDRLPRTSSAADARTASPTSAIFDEDEDVPAEYKGLFSTELLNVLLVPFDYVCKQKTVTDKLLAQYLPPRSIGRGDVTLNTVDSNTYHNVYGIAPGFRWDGVVRGRGPVE